MRYAVLLLLMLPNAALTWAGVDSAREATIHQPLAARYQETRRVAGEREESRDWYFIRQNDQVETARGDYAEVWRRDERGEIALTRVFHRDRKLIQYTPGELRTQGRQRDWSSLNSIFDPRRLAGLKPAGTATVLGRPALRYTGKLGEERIEVLWLTGEALAARFVRSGRNGRVSLELRELRSSPDSRWPQASLAKADRYAFLDGADLGDMEHDPFVRRVLGADSGEGAHAHHAH